MIGLECFDFLNILQKNKFGFGIILFVSRLYNIQTLSFTHIKPKIWFLNLYDIVRAHFLAGTESASSYLCAVLPLDARQSCRVSMLWQVQYVVFLLHQQTFMKQCVKDARRRRGDTKSIERRQPGAGYETCLGGAGEWVAGGLAPGIPNEESLPAGLSIQPHQLIWSLPDWHTTRGLNGHLGPYTVRCVCLLRL